MRQPILIGAMLAAALATSGCSTLKGMGIDNPFTRADDKDKAVASEGQRISIIAFDQKIEAAESLKGKTFTIPAATPLADWPLPGANPEQSLEHVEAGGNFQIAWRKGFGKGSDKGLQVTAPPIMAAGRLYVMDAEGDVAALDPANGSQIWRAQIRSTNRRDRQAFGGGLAFADGKLYVSSGHRVMTQLDAATGAQIWRQETASPLHAAPTVHGGRVFVVSTDNELLTFDAATGAPGWTYQALVEPARVLGASSPAVTGDTVVAAFASGEVIAFRATNGNDLWTQALSRASRTNALSEIRDVAGRPVISRGDVYAASHSDVFAAIDLRTGQPRWSLPVASVGSPWAAGDVVYLISKAGEVICVSRDKGEVYWIRDLNEGKKKKQRAIWSGPILASNRLVAVSSNGEAVSMDPLTGAVQQTLKLGGPALIAPIAVGGTIYVVTDEAQLVAIR